MAKPKLNGQPRRHAFSGRSWTEQVEAQLDALADAITHMSDILDVRLKAIEDAHNLLDRQCQSMLDAMRYQLLYVMQRIEIAERPNKGGILIPDAPIKRGMLYEFWIRDRETFIHDMQAMEATIAAKLQATAAANPTDDGTPQGTPALDDRSPFARGPAKPQ